MAVLMRELLAYTLDSLRYEFTAKRIRVSLDDTIVADTTNGLLVWEPRRVAPTYAVPAQDISAELRPTNCGPDAATPPILDPTIPFTNHTAAGESYDVVIGDVTRPSAAFRPDDADLDGYIVLDFAAFDWREEDEPIVSHPHDPYGRIDTLRSSRHVQIEADGQVLADSKRPVLLFETGLPVRYYLPPDDVTAPLVPTDTISYCAYKGQASYFSLPGVRDDVAWTYHQPLHDAVGVRDYICFFNEHVDIVVDGRREDRPTTPWSD